MIRSMEIDNRPKCIVAACNERVLGENLILYVDKPEDMYTVKRWLQGHGLRCETESYDRVSVNRTAILIHACAPHWSIVEAFYDMLAAAEEREDARINAGGFADVQRWGLRNVNFLDDEKLSAILSGNRYGLAERLAEYARALHTEAQLLGGGT